MANLDQIQLPDNTSHYTKTIFRGETGSTSTSTAFVVTVSGITSLYDGLTVVIKNTVVASASGCTLNVNSTGAKAIWVSYSNVACTTHWGLNQTYLFIYDLTNDRWELQQGRDRDTDSNTIGEYAGIAKAGGGNMTQYGLVMQTQLNPPLFASIVTTSSTGTKTKQACGFIPNGKVLYYSGATLTEGENTKVSDIWITINGMNLRYSFNISTSTLPATVIGKSIYIKCTKNSTDGKLYLADTTW